MKRIFLLCFLLAVPHLGIAAVQQQVSMQDSSKNKNQSKNEVLDNPTLKTLSGSLSSYSFYSSFSFKGSSLSHPFSVERPNITEASEIPNLQSLSGNAGIKYRLGQKDNLSLQVGLYMAAPFHSHYESRYPKVQREFAQNAQKLNVDDPRLSYFRTYYLGKLQNVTIATMELTTRGVLTDYGYWGNFSLNHASAFSLAPQFYLAGTLALTQMFFDEDTMRDSRGRIVSLRPYQTARLMKAGLSLEYYVFSQLAVRLISDVGVYYQMRGEDLSQWQRRNLLQTLAMTYFYNRDISIAPNLGFLLQDLRWDKTNLGLTLTINL